MDRIPDIYKIVENLKEMNKVYILGMSIVFFLTLTVIFFLILITKRTLTIIHQRQISKLSKNNTLIIEQVLFSENPLSSRLVSIFLKRKIARKSLMEELLYLRKNLNGDLARRLTTFYMSSGLINDTLKKIHSSSWHIRCKGLKELGDMRMDEFAELAHMLIQNKNRFIRDEAVLCYIRLSGFDGLKFLNNYKYDISDWQQANLIHVLQAIETIPPLPIGLWLNSDNQSVRLFALRLIAHFRQCDNTLSLGLLLGNPRATIRIATLKAIGALQLFDYFPLLQEMHSTEKSLWVQAEIGKTLKIFGHEETSPSRESEETNENCKIIPLNGKMEDHGSNVETPDLTLKIKVK